MNVPQPYPLIVLRPLTPRQCAAINAAAKSAGVTPTVYLARIVARLREKWCERAKVYASN